MFKFLFPIWVLMMAAQLNSLEFIPSTDPRLNQKSAPLSLNEIKSKETQNIIDAMLKLSGLEANPDNYEAKGVLVGLAAPQVGIMKQIIIVNTSTASDIRQKKPPRFDVLINPKIVEQSEETQKSKEGCFSVPDAYFGIVERPKDLTVEGYTRDGERIKKNYKNESAAVIDHEIDHLKGIRFPQKLNSEKELQVSNKTKGSSHSKKENNPLNKQSHALLWKQMKEGDYSQA